MKLKKLTSKSWLIKADNAKSKEISPKDCTDPDALAKLKA